MNFFLLTSGYFGSQNWNAARLHCEASGMRLASVESAAQRDVLVSKGNTTHFNDGKYQLRMSSNYVYETSTDTFYRFQRFGLLELMRRTIIKLSGLPIRGL